ncbi:hypothetical protein MHYP_G00327380 [Metynnis hypsauchen]
MSLPVEAHHDPAAASRALMCEHIRWTDQPSPNSPGRVRSPRLHLAASPAAWFTLIRSERCLRKHPEPPGGEECELFSLSRPAEAHQHLGLNHTTRPRRVSVMFIISLKLPG